MAKRFGDTSKWDRDWYLLLTPVQKLICDFIEAKCDGGGFLVFSLRTLKYYINAEVTEDDLKALEPRVLRVAEDVLWATWCVFLQQKKLTVNNKAHIGIARSIVEKTDGLSLVGDALKVREMALQVLAETSSTPSRPSVDPQPTPDRPPTEGQSTVIGKEIRDKGKEVLGDGGVGEGDPPPVHTATPEAQEACEKAWLETLEEFGAPRPSKELGYQERVAISLSIKRNGAGLTRAALVGRRFEEATERFTPNKHLGIARTFEPDRFDKFVNLAALAKAGNTGDSGGTESGTSQPIAECDKCVHGLIRVRSRSNNIPESVRCTCEKGRTRQGKYRTWDSNLFVLDTPAGAA